MLVPKISVLVPIYNTEKYLPECLSSLKAQKLEDIEFICINDGSTDSSLSIIKSYVQSDSRFRLIDKANSGYGASMNCGLDVAKGEYIGIVESDDFASPRMFKTLYKYASQNDCDLVKSNYYEHSNQGDVKIKAFSGFPYKKVFDPAEMAEIIKIPPYIWTALYRRSMLVEHGIRFNETPGASFQDTSFVFRSWVAARRAMLLPRAYLHYRVDNSGSSVKSSSKIYEVCGELQTSENFIRQNKDFFETFSSLLNVVKFNTYRWNYNRIAVEYRLEFTERWAQEFYAAQKEGILHQEHFSDHDWSLVQELMENPQEFFEKYKKELKV